MNQLDVLSPIRIGSLELKNRAFMAPLTRCRATVADGVSTHVPNALMAEYYAQRASAGLIVAEATMVMEGHSSFYAEPGVWSAEQVAGWKLVTQAVHANGGRMFLQLWHGGRACHPVFNAGATPVAPSAIAIRGFEVQTPQGKVAHGVPRELATSEIPGIVAGFRAAAERAKEAGFDGVELHGANGYLIDQFLQSCSNTRTDEYGGSPEKRFRLLKEVIAAVSTVFPASRIGVRLSPNGAFNNMGSADNLETFTYVIKQLDTLSLMYLHVLDGLAFGFHNKCEVFRASRVRALFHGPLIGNCGYSKDGAEAVINAGALDAVAFGRPFLANPDLVERFRKSYPLADTPPYPLW
jgi:2,4-dienoyl-CoA reductase-like NADH-dependent reductase (Old Yellow Enzyme family)